MVQKMSRHGFRVLCEIPDTDSAMCLLKTSCSVIRLTSEGLNPKSYFGGVGADFEKIKKF